MDPIQIKNFVLPFKPGYYKGSSEYHLRNIWLKIKEKGEDLSLSLMCNELNNQKLKINILVSSQSLSKMKSRFQKRQCDFQIFTKENDHFCTFKFVLSNQGIKLINGREKQPSDRIIDIVGVNFIKIAELHQGKLDYKYDNILRVYSSLHSLGEHRFIA